MWKTKFDGLTMKASRTPLKKIEKMFEMGLQRMDEHHEHVNYVLAELHERLDLFDKKLDLVSQITSCSANVAATMAQQTSGSLSNSVSSSRDDSKQEGKASPHDSSEWEKDSKASKVEDNG